MVYQKDILDVIMNHRHYYPQCTDLNNSKTTLLDFDLDTSKFSNKLST